MAKNSITDYDNTSGNNTDVQSVDISEGCSPSGINNAIREVMADLADVNDGTVALTSPQAANMTVTGTVTTDTIAENTSAAGVTIDGVLLKDGGVGSATAAIAAYLSSINGGQIGGNRNLIINGAMQVAQRGVSTSFAHDGTASAYTVDRFEFTISNNHETFDCTVTQDSDAPDGFSNCIKITTGTEESSIASDEFVFLRQRIEGQNLQHLKYGTSAAVFTTVSFYVKSSVTGTFGITMYSADGSRNIGTTYTINSANTWEYKTATFAGDASGTINNDNGDALNVIWHLSSGSDFDSTDNTSWGAYSNARWAFGHAQDGVVTTASATWQITGVQVELGETATSFEHRSYGDELARCQRYYQENDWTTNQLPSVHRFDNTGLPYNFFSFLCEMRASPTFTQSGSWNSGSGNAGTPTLQGASTVGATLRGNNGNISANTGQWLRGGIVKFDAEI